jgi:hypothetical protein
MEVAVTTYSKTNSFTYESPKSRRFFTVKAKRLVRLAKRVHDGRLFIPDIVGLLRQAANELIALGGFLLLTEKGTDILKDLAWILSPTFAPEGLSWDIREKARHRASPPERCGLCGVKLVWPAQIVWRRGFTVVDVSESIGIQCLTHKAVREGWGKLNHLIEEVRALLNTVPEHVVAAAEAPRPLAHGTLPMLPATPQALPLPPSGLSTSRILQLPLIYPGDHRETLAA